MRAALLLIGFQNDYFPGGKMELPGAEAAASQAAELLEQCRARNLPVIHVQQVPARHLPGHFWPDTEGVRIHKSVAPIAGERVLEKRFPNSFRETPLLEHLRSNGIDTLAIAGMPAWMCVDATARAAFDLGLEVFLLYAAMTSSDLIFKGQRIPASQVNGAFLAALGRVYGRLSTNAEFLQAQSVDRMMLARPRGTSKPDERTSSDERRRSPRIRREVPLLLVSGTVAAHANTENISAHGALVVCAEPFFQGAELVVTNQRTAMRTKAWVVWSRPADHAGRFALGIDFLEHVPGFWGKEYSL